MIIKQYDKVKLKDGRTATIVEVYKPGVAYIADIDLPGPDWETVDIKESEIESVIG